MTNMKEYKIIKNSIIFLFFFILLVVTLIDGESGIFTGYFSGIMSVLSLNITKEIFKDY